MIGLLPIYLRPFFYRAIGIVALYGVYAGVREVAIHYLERGDTRRSYRVLITNQITAFLVVYLSIGLFLTTFHLVSESIGLAYFIFIPSVLFVFMGNTYWLFPIKGNLLFIHYKVIRRLLLSTLICTIPFALIYVKVLYHDDFFFIFCTWWATQLFITTPISWVLYQQRKDKILQLRGVEKELVKSQRDLQFLRSQINPHFLFNAFNTLYGTALREKSKDTAEGIQKLGDMMRFMLDENNLDFIPMSRKIEYLKNYISLQKLRIQYSPHILIEDSIDEKHCDHSIAPMILIPFVENAFKHGISLTEKSWIKIKLECEEKSIRFEVRNSMHPGQDNDPEKEKSGIGLHNVLERLTLLYGSKHTFYAKGDGNEFIVQVSIEASLAR